MKRILVTGMNGYVGISLGEWFKQFQYKYNVEYISLRNESWKENDFSVYDTIFHAAGIAHTDVSHVTEAEKQSYYQINRDLTLEVARKAKSAGVRQFIFMSSIIVYGNSGEIGKNKVIFSSTQPNPDNFYGDSKLQAEKEILKLDSDSFRVAIIRAPMIYGKGSKGNYPILAKLAIRLPIFPNIKNQRSILHIDNLCEFIRLIIDNDDRGIFFPQNEEYSSTVEIVRSIAEVHNHKVLIISLFNWILILMSRLPGKTGRIVNKAFGNLVYDKALSQYNKGNYRIRDFRSSIVVTENS